MADYKDDSKTVTRVLSSTTYEPAERPDGRVKEGAWIRLLTFLRWYPKDMPSEEKKLILRLDLSILIFGCLSFFTKYLDQASLTNAYVSGMREDLNFKGNDLNFKGNDLNYVTATFWASWDVGEKGRLAGFFLTGFQGVMSPMTMSWATVIMAGDAEERAIVTASMNAIGQAIAAGTQIVQFPASGAPNFHAGFSSALATTVVQLVVIFPILFLWNRDKKKAFGRSAGQGQEHWNMSSQIE